MATSATSVGATGLVGSRLLDELGRLERLEVWTRRPLSLPAGARAIVSPEPPPDGDDFWQCDVLFVALGTTIGRAGSQAAFEAVDLHLVVECARRARSGGSRTLALVSAMGADAGSRVFYNRVKGRAEAAVRELGFPRLAIARPSLLLGDREERRPTEWLARRIAGPLRGLFPRSVRPVRDREVARSLAGAALDLSWTGERILENADLLG